MPVTITHYNHTARLLAGQEIDLSTLKFMLLSSDATFDATDTDLDQVAGAPDPSDRPNEVYGNGWTQGGMALQNVTVTTVTTNDAKIDADDIIVTATGGPIGPARYAVIYDNTHANKAVISFIDFGQNETAGQDTDFRVVWDANGIIPISYTP